ncbi:hypothetical protein BVI434_1060015 [Burkholderia vietnamiensis]|nr:hypothetical protein BVI434_1060015 [Burkholderia vietnamiensis]
MRARFIASWQHYKETRAAHLSSIVRHAACTRAPLSRYSDARPPPQPPSRCSRSRPPPPAHCISPRRAC